MINPTEKDIGRRVFLKQNWMKSNEYEYGFIRGFNSFFVFVQYGLDTNNKSTKREYLYWDFEKIKNK